MVQVEISVDGKGSAIRPAERAIISLSAESPRVSTTAEASEIITSTANRLRELLTPLCPQDEKTRRTLPDAPVVHYSMSSIETASHPVFHYDTKEYEDTLFSAHAGFEIKVQDFAILNKITTTFSSMENVTIKSITWKLTDSTLEAIKGGARKRAGADAIQKAWDYAEVFAGVSGSQVELRRRVRPVAVGENNFGYNEINRPHLHHGKGMRGSRTASEELQFEPEDVRLEVSVSARFVVSLDEGKFSRTGGLKRTFDAI